MFHENEWDILCETFRKCRVQASLRKLSDPIRSLPDGGYGLLVNPEIPPDTTIGDCITMPPPKTMVKSANRFSLRYIYLAPGEDMPDTILLIGPYLTAPLPAADLMEMAEKLRIPAQSVKHISRFYAGVPVLRPDSHLFVLLDTFCERMWDATDFTVIDQSDDLHLSPLQVLDTDRSDSFDTSLIHMKLMEERYAFENQLIDAVSRGQIQKENLLLSSFTDQLFEKRVADPIRNAKNYSIIMNTLLRKAAEKGGVHPVHLDQVSSSFARKIESITSLPENASLMGEMFRSYCRLVRKHSLQGYSPIVRKTVLLIQADLSADLSLNTLAEAQNVSAGYLATVFKKETDQTLSEFIREKRIKHAIHLLSTTHLQIQSIAIHCGIMDVQYFSKIFKKAVGKTPKEYREYIKSTAGT